MSKVTIGGMQAFTQKMAELPDALRKKVMLGLMRDAMRIVRDDARLKAPKLARAVLDSSGVPKRLPDTLRKAISVRTSKQEAKAGNIGIFVNVKPLPGNLYKRAGKAFVLTRKSRRSASNPRDPYYWRWMEFGTKQRRTKSGKNAGATRAYKFLQGSAASLKLAADRALESMLTWAKTANTTGKF